MVETRAHRMYHMTYQIDTCAVLFFIRIAFVGRSVSLGVEPMSVVRRGSTLRTYFLPSGGHFLFGDSLPPLEKQGDGGHLSNQNVFPAHSSKLIP